MVLDRLETARVGYKFVSAFKPAKQRRVIFFFVAGRLERGFDGGMGSPGNGEGSSIFA